MALVLFVDDEAFFASRYLEHLRKQFDVTFIESAGEVFPFLGNRPPIAAFVLDVMMPPPEGAPDSATNDGLATGLWLLKEIQSKHADYAATPVMILTNRNPAGVRTELREMGVSASAVEVRQKTDTPAFLLPKLLSSLIDRVRAAR